MGRTPELQPAVIEALQRDPSRPRRFVEALAAGTSLPASLVPLLAPIATPTVRTRVPGPRPSDVAKRLAAIEALGRIEKDGRDAAHAALKPLVSDSDARVRYRVARALRRLDA